MSFSPLAKKNLNMIFEKHADQYINLFKSSRLRVFICALKKNSKFNYFFAHTYFTYHVFQNLFHKLIS